MLCDDERTHLRWDAALGGRRAAELPAAELRALVDDGMPLKHRLQLWSHWFALKEDVGVVEETQRGVHPEVASQIELDVLRTGTQWLGIAECFKLRRILRAFATLNPTIGYCQGLNNITAVLIVLGFDEAVALRGLCSIVQTSCPGYHEPGLKGYMRDIPVLGALVRSLLPDISRRLDASNVPLDVLASTHFLTLTACAWPLIATVELWDLILLEGQPAVFASFLALLQLYLPSSNQLSIAGGPEGMEDAMDPVSFRLAVQQGIAKDHASYLRQVRALISLIPQESIEHLRRSTTVGVDRSSD